MSKTITIDDPEAGKIELVVVKNPKPVDEKPLKDVEQYE